MKKRILIGICAVLLLTSCAHEYNQVYKTTNNDYKYEFAKECFAKGKYGFAVPLLQDLVTIEKGTDNAQECLYMLAMAEYCLKDYQAASETFKKYYQSLFEGTPEPRLDQTPTVAAIAAFQEYLDIFPNGKMKETAQQRLFALQDKLVRKEYLNAKLYYNLGSYFGNSIRTVDNNGGNNYEACIITAQNALNDYPYSNMREDFAILIMKSKFELAQMSVEEKKVQRFQDAEDECYGFINEYPESKERKIAEDYIKKCKQITKD